MELLMLLRRRLCVVDFLGIMIGAALAGHAAANLLAAALSLHPAAEARPARQKAPAPLPAGDKSIDRIVARNVFCSTCGGAPVPARCRRAYTLLAIMVAPTDQLLGRPPRSTSGWLGTAPEAIADGIRKTGAHAYEVRRVVIDRLLGG